MKNIKCIIGATILAPIALSAFIAAIFCMIWVVSACKLGFLLGVVCAGLGLLVLLVGLWSAIYDYCVKHH